MKGTLHKTEKGWVVFYDENYLVDAFKNDWGDAFIGYRALPIHPDDLDSEIIRFANNGSLDNKEVEFCIVHKLQGVNDDVITYAKLIEPKTGSKVNLQRLEAKLDKILAEETPESFHKWLESKRGPIRNYHSPKIDEMLKEIEEDDVEKLAKQEVGWWDENDNDDVNRFVQGYNKAKETLYTEEQMIQASKYGYEFRDTTSFPEHKFEDSCINNTKQWLQSLKQYKKD